MASSPGRSTGFILVVAGALNDRKRFCEAATQHPFRSIYDDPREEKASIEHHDHILLSQPIVFNSPSDSIKSELREIRLLSVDEFSASPGKECTSIDIFASLSALVVTLHMRNEPLLGIVYLHDSKLTRLSGAGRHIMNLYGRYFVGADGQVPFAFVLASGSKSKRVVDTSGILNQFSRKGSMKSDSAVGQVFTDFRWSFSNADSGDTASAQRILSWLISRGSDGRHSSPRGLLYDELREKELEKGLYDTELGKWFGNWLAERAKEISSSAHEPNAIFEDPRLQTLSDAFINEVASIERAVSTLHLSPPGSAEPFIQDIGTIQAATKSVDIIVAFGSPEGLAPPKSDGDVQLRWVTSNAHQCILLVVPKFENTPVDAAILSTVSRWLAFLRNYRFNILGLAAFIHLPTSKVARIDAAVVRNLDLIHAICGPAALEYLVLVKHSGKWAEKERNSRVFRRFTDAKSCLIDIPPQKQQCNASSWAEALSAEFQFRQKGLQFDDIALLGERKAKVVDTSAGQIILKYLTDSLSAVQDEIAQSPYETRSSSKSPMSPSPSPEMRALYLQLDLIRFSESFNLYTKMYSELEKDSGLKKAINRLEALLLCQSDTYPDKHKTCGQLGALYQEHFDAIGGGLEQGRDLEKAIKHYGDAVKLLDATSPVNRSAQDRRAYAKERAAYLGALTRSLDLKFQLFGKKNDLVQAIYHCGDVVNNFMIEAGYSDTQKAVTRHVFGTLLKNKFQTYFDDVADIDSAIGQFHQAENLLPPGHQGIPIIISDICEAYTLRSKYNDDHSKRCPDAEKRQKKEQALRDVENAIREYSRMRPEPSSGHLAYPVLQNAKCKAWSKHWKMCMEIEKGRLDKYGPGCVSLSDAKIEFKVHRNLDEAILAGEEAVKYSHDTAQECDYLVNLGKAYAYRWLWGDRSPDVTAKEGNNDLEEALLCLRGAAETEGALCITRFKAARNWGRWARIGREKGDKEILLAYKYCICLLSQLTSLDIPIDEQYRRLEKIQGMAYIAIEQAIVYGELGKAVEWFEEGRGVVWRHYFRRDELMDSLREKGGAVAEAEALIEEWEGHWKEGRLAVIREKQLAKLIVLRTPLFLPLFPSTHSTFPNLPDFRSLRSSVTFASSILPHLRTFRTSVSLVFRTHRYSLLVAFTPSFALFQTS
ncbi:hypothetical protein CC2G_002284 [Coprinopsis cinerea AmutBmut pab1-1]|nr:hypothetical protein CC2G_002284 [Coprinopsis cinerea AmutBmut pab1-1]